MDGLTYAVIALCYSFGCLAAFRLGKSYGSRETLENLVNHIAQKERVTPKQVIDYILGRKA